MFAAALTHVVTAAVRVAPAVVTIATSPVTRSLLRVGGTQIAIGVVFSTVRLQAKDNAFQEAAEQMHRDRDPKGFMESSAPIRGLRRRLLKNLSYPLRAAEYEAKQIRKVLVVVPLAASYWRYNVQAKKFDAFTAEHPDHDRIHTGNAVNPDAGGSILYTPEEAAAHVQSYENDPEWEFCGAHEKRIDKYETAAARYHRLLHWFRDSNVRLAGAKYYDEQVLALKKMARENAVDASSVSAVYVRLLDDKLNSGEYDVERFPERCGEWLRSAVVNEFSAEEAGVILKESLRPWIAQTHQVSDDNWALVLKGWTTATEMASNKEG